MASCSRYLLPCLVQDSNDEVPDEGLREVSVERQAQARCVAQLRAKERETSRQTKSVGAPLVRPSHLCGCRAGGVETCHQPAAQQRTSRPMLPSPSTSASPSATNSLTINALHTIVLAIKESLSNSSTANEKIPLRMTRADAK